MMKKISFLAADDLAATVIQLVADKVSSLHMEHVDDPAPTPPAYAPLPMFPQPQYVRQEPGRIYGPRLSKQDARQAIVELLKKHTAAGIGSTQADVARETGLAASTVSAEISQMVKEGLAEIMGTNGHRSKYYRLASSTTPPPVPLAYPPKAPAPAPAPKPWERK